jgi:hypothetical protein
MEDLGLNLVKYLFPRSDKLYLVKIYQKKEQEQL